MVWPEYAAEQGLQISVRPEEFIVCDEGEHGIKVLLQTTFSSTQHTLQCNSESGEEVEIIQSHQSSPSKRAERFLFRSKKKRSIFSQLTEAKTFFSV